jgi:ribosome-associated toxin RatA of RatAB toxin-antitoxin module
MVMAASPEQCFDVVADFERYPDWAADVKEVDILSRDSEGRPSEVAFRAAAFGRSTSYTLAYDFADAPRSLSWKIVSGDLTSMLDGSYSFEGVDGGGTEVTYAL